MQRDDGLFVEGDGGHCNFKSLDPPLLLLWISKITQVHNVYIEVFTKKLLARCYVVTSFCNIWWHHFATFDDIILNDLHILDFE